jgi:SAM-dependent methyltransferase
MELLTVSTSSSPAPYVLGTGDDELSRLGLQHRLWSDAATDAWKRAGFGPGSRLLDIGSGPGFASFDLAQLVTPSGSVLGVDESPTFIEHLTMQAEARGLRQLRGVVGDAQDLQAAAARSSEARDFDGAYARWVLCFVKSPERVINGAAALLRSGGRFVIHDYFNYTSMTAAPRLESHDALVQATANSWRSRGGDPDVVARVPRLLSQAGLEVAHMQVHQRIARGGLSSTGLRDPMLAWPLTWWRTYAPKLVDMGLITHELCARALADLDEIERDHTRFIVCPPVFEVIAVKR